MLNPKVSFIPPKVVVGEQKVPRVGGFRGLLSWHRFVIGASFFEIHTMMQLYDNLIFRLWHGLQIQRVKILQYESSGK